jgi:SAM-dependent methyltransferase
VSDNAEEIRRWNEVCGPLFLEREAHLDRMLEGPGRAALAAGAARPGESVIDVGCGAGATTLALAEAVGPSGRVLAVDPATALLARARARAEAAGHVHVRFVEADAQSHGFEPGGFHLAYSRFGVMFFADPLAAFRNLGRALREGGRLAFACWQAVDRNPWVALPLAAIASTLSLPPRPPPGAPGPFAFADAERVAGLLRAAGFGAVEVQEVRMALPLGETLDEAVAFALTHGPAGAALREAGLEDARSRAEPEVRSALAPFERPGGVRVPSAAWIFRALRLAAG